MTDARKILVVFGTRPEAIKLFPVINALAAAPGIAVRTCVTAQHRGLLDQVMTIAGLIPDIDLDLMEPGQSLDRLTARMAKEGRGVIVYLREGSVGVAKPTPEPSSSADPLAAAEIEAHASAHSRAENWREIGLGAQILKDLGVASIRLISSRTRRYVGLEGFGIAIEGTEAL